MDFKSKRTWLGILAGMVVTVVCGLLRFSCWGVLLGVSAGAYVADISSPKQGAVMGALSMLPLGVVYLFQMQQQVVYDFNHFPLITIVQIIALPILFAALGALLGTLTGFGFRAAKRKQYMF